MFLQAPQSGHGTSPRRRFRVVIPITSNTAILLVNLVNSMVFSIPSVKAATLAEIAPVAAACPAANRVAALIVEDASAAGTDRRNRVFG